MTTRANFIVPSDNNSYAAAQTGREGALEAGTLQGLSLGWADEIGGLFGADVAGLRARRRAAADSNPSAFRTGQFLGSVASPVNFLPAGWLMRGGAGLGRVAAVGAGIGGATGAAETLGEMDERRGLNTDTVARTAAGGALGAAAGGTIAPALYTLGSGVRAGGRYLADWAAGGNRSAIAKTAQALERQGTDVGALMGQLTADGGRAVRSVPEPVLADILQGLQAGQTATQVAGNIALRHPGVKVSPQQVGAISAGFNRANPVPRDLIKLSEEVGGGESGRSGLTSLMQGVSSLPGRGREIALRNMGATMESAPERLSSRLSQETGQGLDFRQAFNKRQISRQAAATVAYDKAIASDFARAIDTGTSSIIRSVQPILMKYSLRAHAMGGERQSHLASAIEIMGGLRGKGRNLAEGQIGIETLGQFHRQRKEFDRLLAGLNRSPNAADQDAARILNEMRTELNAAVHGSNPAFKAADRRFASDLAREEAMLAGRQFPLQAGAKRDEALAELAALERRHPSNAREIRDHFTQGLLRNLADNIENRGGIPTQWMQPMTGGIKPAQREALTQALGAPLPGAQAAKRGNRRTGAVAGEPVPYQPGRKIARGATGALEDEARLRKIFTDVFGNSNTAGKLAAQEDLREMPRIAAEMASGGWLTTLRQAVVDRLIRAMTERNTEQIARIVTETDPRVLFMALHEIRRTAGLRQGGEMAISLPSISTAAGVGQQATGP